MLIKLLNSISKRFKKNTPEKNVRELVNKTKSETTEKNKKGKRRKIMADEKEVKDVEVKDTETEKKDIVEKDNADKPADVIEKKDDEKTEDEKTEEVVDEKVDDEATAMVEETEPVGNGVRIEDIVTKDILADRLSALEAKLDAILKENSDLKDRLSAKDDELTGMKDKYEKNDFGNYQKQGTPVRDKVANSSFDEYSKQFMS